MTIHDLPDAQIARHNIDLATVAAREHGNPGQTLVELDKAIQRLELQKRKVLRSIGIEHPVDVRELLGRLASLDFEVNGTEEEGRTVAFVDVREIVWLTSAATSVVGGPHRAANGERLAKD